RNSRITGTLTEGVVPRIADATRRHGEGATRRGRDAATRRHGDTADSRGRHGDAADAARRRATMGEAIKPVAALEDLFLSGHSAPGRTGHGCPFFRKYASDGSLPCRVGCLAGPRCPYSSSPARPDPELPAPEASGWTGSGAWLAPNPAADSVLAR